jgi:hypothetical protein
MSMDDAEAMQRMLESGEGLRAGTQDLGAGHRTQGRPTMGLEKAQNTRARHKPQDAMASRKSLGQGEDARIDE